MNSLAPTNGTAAEMATIDIISSPATSARYERVRTSRETFE